MATSTEELIALSTKQIELQKEQMAQQEKRMQQKNENNKQLMKLLTKTPDLTELAANLKL